MTGLPRVKSTLRTRPVWERMTVQPIERMTEWVMSGAEIGEADLQDMKALVQRASALGRAIEAREAILEKDE